MAYAKKEAFMEYGFFLWSSTSQPSRSPRLLSFSFLIECLTMFADSGEYMFL